MEANGGGRGLQAHTAMLASGHVATRGATLSPFMSSIRGMPPTLHHKHPIHVDLSSGHDSLTVDPWTHCHPFGGHQPTLELPSNQAFTRAGNATAFGSKP